MVRVIKRKWFTIGKFEEVYHIDIDGDATVTPARVVRFYQGRRLQDSRVDGNHIRLTRARGRRAFNFSDLSLRQEIDIELRPREDGVRLVCSYRCFVVPLGTLRFPPWDLEEEVRLLEAFLGDPAGQVPAVSEARGSGRTRPTPLLRVLYGMYRASSGLRYHIMRRFSRPGLAVLCGLFVMTLMGLDTENTIAYQAFTVLLAMVLIAVLLNLRFRGRFSVERLMPRFGTVGTPIRYSLRIGNADRRWHRDLRVLEDLADPRPGYEEWRQFARHEMKLSTSLRPRRSRAGDPFRRAKVGEGTVPALAPSGGAEVQLQLTPLRRGVLRFVGVTVARADPMGLFRAFVRVSAPQTTVVLPRRYPLPHIALPGAMQYQEGGVALASNVGRSDEFVALRDYRRGDPMRQIHWRSWAKVGRPIVKECEDEFFVRHALVLDTFVDNPFSDVFEEAVSVAASFANTVVSQESLLDLLFVGAEAYCFTAGRGLAEADQLLEILASVQPCRDQPFASLETAVVNHVEVVSGCICVLLRWDAARQELVRKLRMLDVPVKVLVITGAGSREPIEPGPMRDVPAEFHVLEVGHIEEGLTRLA